MDIAYGKMILYTDSKGGDPDGMRWLLISGVGALTGYLIYSGLMAGRYRCPVCGERFRLNEELVRFGQTPCPKCGTSVEVDH